MRTRITLLLALLAALSVALLAVGCTKQGESTSPDTTPAAKTVTPAPTPAPPAAPAAEKKPAETEKQEPAKETPKVTIATTKGDLGVTLYPKEAPKSVERFLSLAKSGYYDNMVWHRVVPGFVIQTGKGPEKPPIPDEVNAHKHQAGALAFAKPGSPDPGRLSKPDSATTEFYIAMGEAPHLDSEFTVFGQVTKGLEIVSQITTEDRIKHIEVAAAP